MLLKSTLERVLDTKLKEVEERNTLLLAETVRRHAVVFNGQFTILKQLPSVAYKLRNRVRELKGAAAGRVEGAMSRVADSAIALEEMLIDHRAIIPPEIFGIAHRLKGGAKIVDPQDTEHLQLFLSEFDSNFARLSELIVERVLGE